MNRFSIYLEKLKKLDIKNSFLEEHKNTDKIVLLLSGSSNYETAALSAEQFQFLSIFKNFGYTVIESNFPYNRDFNYQNYIDENILKASYVTAIYYLHTLFNKDFQREIKRNLEPIFNLKNLIIITQSSGLNVLNRFLDFFEEQELKNKNIKVIALGPVGKKSKKLKYLETTIIKGKYDEYSRLLDFHKVDIWLKCRHLSYLKNKKLHSYMYEYLQEK